jgi:hypothetical protein
MALFLRCTQSSEGGVDTALIIKREKYDLNHFLVQLNPFINIEFGQIILLNYGY